MADGAHPWEADLEAMELDDRGSAPGPSGYAMGMATPRHAARCLTVLMMALALVSCDRERDLVDLATLEDESRQAQHDGRFEAYVRSFGDDAAVRLTALMLDEASFPMAAWGLTQLTHRPGATVKSRWDAGMARAAHEGAVLSTGIEEAITALSMLYPEGTADYVALSVQAREGMPWAEARAVSARLFGLTVVHHRDRIRAGRPAMNAEFTDIPGRTKRLE